MYGPSEAVCTSAKTITIGTGSSGSGSGSDTSSAATFLQSAISSGVAASVVVSFAAVAAAGVAISRIPSASAPPSAWAPRAARAWTLLFAAFGLLTFAFCTGIAGVASPFLSMSYAGIGYYYSAFKLCYSYGSVGQCNDLTSMNVVPVIGGAIVIAGLVAFSFAAAVLAGVASARVRRVVVQGVLPPVGGCNAASLPAATALAWVGLVVEIVGAAILWGYYTPTAVLNANMWQFGAGSGLLAASVATHFVSCLLLSVASCCVLGNLPGVGCARGGGCSCCTAEGNAAAAPPEAAAPAELKLATVPAAAV
jgi:hypothetical protein